MSRVPVATLVLNLDGRRHLEACFRSLREEAARDPRLEPWLVDNGSRDGSVELVQERFPEVRVVALGENLGFAGAYDRVLRDEALLGGRPLVALLNNDVRVAPGWLAPLVSAIEPSDVAICGSRLLSADGRTIDHAGGKVAPNGGGVDLGKFEPATPESRVPFETGFACGGSLLVRRDVYLELGGFDPAYVIYHEDVGLGWSAWLAGRRVLHVPASVVYHEGGARMGPPESPRRLYLSQRNRLRNLLRFAGPARLAEGILYSLAFDLARSLKYAAGGDRARLSALWRADLDTLREVGELRHRRGDAQAHRVRSDAQLAAAGIFATLPDSIHAYRAHLRHQRSALLAD